jgi:S1-C subfamily serine protease
MKAAFSLPSGSSCIVTAMSTTYGWDVEPTPEGNNQPPPETKPAPTGATNAMRLLMAGIATCLIGLIGGLGIGWSLAQLHSSATTSSQGPISTVPQTGSTQSSAAQSSGSLNAQAIAAKVDPAVVNINTVVQSGNGSAAGTGIVLTSTGEVLTNNHVVEGATSITVTIAGRSSGLRAHVVGVDPSADVALVQVEGVSGLRTATLADSSTVTVGESIVAIGNAGGVGGTPSASAGSVVALDQSITAADAYSSERLTGMIQINADIAAGESGGPIVNSGGQVVGMITAGQSQGFRSSTATIGYAIPTNKALAVVNQIQSGQASSTVIIGQVGYLGVQVTDLNPTTAARLGLSSTSGALVTGVVAGSPAAGAGLSRYAVITAAAGASVDSSAALGAALHSHKPGEQVQVTWVDSAGSHTATTTLAPGPAI